jgi:RNA polymerase sigma factor (sigma-70 family)
VSEWPSLGRVDDHRLAESLRAGDPEAIAHIFDAYGARLFDYCHALLRDRVAASEALNDALVAAQAHITKLRSPEHFRGWLYALVRNECLRQLNGPGLNRPRQEAPEAVDMMLDAEARTMLQDTRLLVHGALSGLNAQEREAVDLGLRHELGVEDLAGALGLSSEQAENLIAGARVELENALAAAIVARTGRGECPTVAALVDSWDGPISPVARKKLVRHIESCPICDERRERKVATGRLLQSLPVAAMPHDLREHALHAANAPDQAAYRATIAERAEPFDEWGWPSVLDQGRRPRSRSRSRAQTAPPPREAKERKNRLWPAVAAAAAVVLVVGGVFFLMPRGGEDPASGPAALPGPSGEPSAAEVSPSEDSEEPVPTPEETTSAPPTVPPTTRPPSRPRPRPRPTTSRPQPQPGQLSVGSCSVQTDLDQCTITVRAVGGTVRWSITGTGDNVDASGGGTLRAGQTANVTAKVQRPNPCAAGSQTVTFSPRATATVSWQCPA